MWLFWMCAALAVPVVVARLWALNRGRKRVNLMRRHDPKRASEFEQGAYGRSPTRDRSSGQPRRHNRF